MKHGLMMLLFWAWAAGVWSGTGTTALGDTTSSDGKVLKRVINAGQGGGNLLSGQAWRPWQRGFERKGVMFVCDNGSDAQVQRGASQTVVLSQSRPEPIAATVWSRAEGVGGTRNSDYALYLDLVYMDGTPLWGQVDAFNTGSHDWERAEVVVVPEKPVRAVTMHLLLRRHAGRALFRDPMLRVIKPPAGACLFDGVPVTVEGPLAEGFQVRDAAAESDVVAIKKNALGLSLKVDETEGAHADFLEVILTDTTGKDRAVTLIYSKPVPKGDALWFQDPRRTVPVAAAGECMHASRFSAGANGRLSKYPFGAVAVGKRGFGLGIDMAHPAFFRIGFNAATRELFLAYDVGLTPEKPSAHLRFCRYSFDPAWGFRSALAAYYRIFPDAFKRRIPRQGIWMPFARVSAVKGWQDFGFRFKEGANETGWDDRHGMLTFRYTEPMTWWMTMPAPMPRTLAAALAEARRLAAAGDVRAQAFLASGYHDAQGRFPARLLDTPWCKGAVWSINSMPGIAGERTDFSNKWSKALQDKLYGSKRTADLDGEYIDSSEGYVTDELDFRRDHFRAAQTPLTFCRKTKKPAIFRGLIAFEYIRAIERDIHGAGKFMMANSTPIRLCWLAPLLDVMGSETNWHHGGAWRPMSDSDLLYRRALCKGKPYCFLMNTVFDDFSHRLVDRYMQRCMAYGMFPGFFSHNASQGHYFSRPALYERDRPLFKKYIPLCKRLAEAGWRPVTGAVSSDAEVYVERFGDDYLTVFNDSDATKTVTIRLTDGVLTGQRPELVGGKPVNWKNGAVVLTCPSEACQVLNLEAPE